MVVIQIENDNLILHTITQKIRWRLGLKSCERQHNSIKNDVLIFQSISRPIKKFKRCLILWNHQLKLAPFNILPNPKKRGLESGIIVVEDFIPKMISQERYKK